MNTLTPEELDAAELGLPEKRESWVWQHFASHRAQSSVVCLHCGHQKEETHNTSNMIKHLKDAHRLRDVSELLTKAQKRTTSSSVQAKLDFRSPQLTDAQKGRIHDALAIFIAADARPVNLILGRGFRHFVTARSSLSFSSYPPLGS